MKITAERSDGSPHPQCVIRMNDEETLAFQFFLHHLKPGQLAISVKERQLINRLKSQLPQALKEMNTRYDGARKGTNDAR